MIPVWGVLLLSSGHQNWAKLAGDIQDFEHEENEEKQGSGLAGMSLISQQISRWNQALTATMYRGVLSDRERLLSGGCLVRCFSWIGGLFRGGLLWSTSNFRIDGLCSGKIFCRSCSLAEFLVGVAAIEE